MGTISRENEDNFEIIFNSSPIGMFVLNEFFLVEKINDAGLRLFDNQRDAVLGKRFSNSCLCKCRLEDQRGGRFGVHCQSCELNIAANQALETGKSTANMEFQITFVLEGNEVEHWFCASVNPITLMGKHFVVIALVDITDSKEKEISMIRSRDYYQKLLDDLPTLIWKTDKEGKDDYFNKTWLEFTGLELSLAIELGWLDSLHPEDVDRCSKLYKEAFDNRKPFEIEHRRRYKQAGDYHWCITSGKPYFGIQGEFAGFIGVVYDITDRKLAEESSRKYHVLLENALDIILFIDSEGQIIEANTAATRAYGYTREEFLTLKIYDLRQENDETAFYQMQEAYKAGIFFETKHKRKNGDLFTVNVSSQGTIFEDKQVLVSIIRDITERKEEENELNRAKEAAENANRSKSEFLANMSHEIRTPINGIVGMIDLTLLTDLSTEQKENLDLAKTCVDSLLKIINDVLDFSKMEAGKLVIENIPFSLRGLVEEVIKTHASHAKKKGLNLTWELSALIPPVLKGDPSRLRQVLNNLLSNALKFTDQGKVILIVEEIAKTNETIELKFSVKDSGIGISKEEQARLFKTFSQVDGSITRKYGGTGLGLVISKQLIEKMGGSIWAYSEKGYGSSFHFTLKFTSSGELNNKPQVKTKLTKTMKPLRILVAEDDKVNLAVLTLMLKEKGHIVESAADGADAVLLHGQKHYDVIFMDIQMPIMDGMEATVRIREKEGSGRHTPIIALTAYALQGDRERFLFYGMDEYIPKPIKMEELFSILDQVVDKWDKENKRRTEFGHEVSISETGKILNVQLDTSESSDKTSIIQEISEDIKKLIISLDYRDVHAIEAIAHQIKSNCNIIEAEDVKTYAFKTELAARRENIDEIIENAHLISLEFEIFKHLVR